MQTKHQMLASKKAKQMYNYYYAKGIPAVVCRGTSGDAISFHYTPAPFWSDQCVGWVKQEVGKAPVCKLCQLATPPEDKYLYGKIQSDETYESGDSDSLFGRDDVSDKPRPPGLQEFPVCEEQRSKTNKGRTKAGDKTAKYKTKKARKK
jgi:hypothetical protein